MQGERGVWAATQVMILTRSLVAPILKLDAILPLAMRPFAAVAPGTRE
jgi:hypothetical protein